MPAGPGSQGLADNGPPRTFRFRSASPAGASPGTFAGATEPARGSASIKTRLPGAGVHDLEAMRLIGVGYLCFRDSCFVPLGPGIDARAEAPKNKTGEGAGVDTRKLKYFLAVVDHDGFNRAAEHLLIAQPSLSQTIAGPRRYGARSRCRPFLRPAPTQFSACRLAAPPSRIRKGLDRNDRYL